MAKGIQTKKEIRIKAIALFKKSGYDNVSIVEIAKASGISKNTFYYYFASKEDLIRSMFIPDELMDAETAVQMMSIQDPYKRLMDIFSKAASYFSDCGRDIVKKFLVMNLTGQIMQNEKEPIARSDNRAYVQMIQCTFRQAQEADEVRRDISPEELSRITAAMLIGCVQIWATFEKSQNLQDLVRRNIEILVKEPNAEKKSISSKVAGNRKLL